MTDPGGDPACWLDHVCDSCGAFLESDAVDDHVCRTGETPGRTDIEERRGDG